MCHVVYSNILLCNLIVQLWSLYGVLLLKRVYYLDIIELCRVIHGHYNVNAYPREGVFRQCDPQLQVDATVTLSVLAKE